METFGPHGGVEIVQSGAVWGDLRAGILVDRSGKQYRFVTYEDDSPRGQSHIEYRVLDPARDLVWLDQIAEA